MNNLIYTTKIFNSEKNRVIDNNGFMYVKKSPVLKAGVLEYYGEEFNTDSVDGVNIEKDKLYKVYIPIEELEKAKDTFKLKPIVEDHEWLGREGSNARDYQEGTTGEKVFMDGDYLMIDLQFNNLDTIQKIQNDEKKELSASYENTLEKAPNGADYDFVARDIRANHIALVEKGRCGSDVKVFNSLLTKKSNKKMPDFKLIMDGKEIDLNKFISEEQQEGDHNDSITETDNTKSCNEDKRKIIDEIGGILKDKVDEELWRTIIGKVEKLSYEGSETSKTDNEEEDKKISCQNMSESEIDDEVEEDKKQEKKDGVKAMNYDKMYTKIYNSVKQNIEKENQARFKAYNSAKNLCGEFDYMGMSELDILNQGLSSIGLKADSVIEANAMIKAYNSTATRIDNSFSYEENGGNCNYEINLDF